MRYFSYTLFIIFILSFGMATAFAQTPEQFTVLDPQTDDESYPVNYGVNGATVDDISIYPQHKSIVVTLRATADGNFTIKLPREVIDAKSGTNDEQFSVLVDKKNTDFNETKTSTDRTIIVSFPMGTKQIEIIGTSVVPEFGGLSGVVLLIAILSIVAISAKSSLKLGH
jgi:predicted secreted protein with PEFG-CTERM motif